MLKVLQAIKLLRIPFSIFLMPVYWLALINISEPDLIKAIHVFVIIHILVYPASNGYNSHFDKDEGSIGGLKNPPPVNKYLYPLVLVFDSLALIYSYYVAPRFAIMILMYLLVSKAYSYDRIRLKQFPIVSTLVVIVFQGLFLYLSIQYGIGMEVNELLERSNIILGACASIFLLGSYPLTQVYQHAEDKKRGDYTISIMLGIKGTFIFSSLAFLLGSMLLCSWFIQHRSVNEFLIFVISTSPILWYFGFWFKRVIRDNENANYESAMRMNMLSSICLSVAFVLILR